MASISNANSGGSQSVAQEDENSKQDLEISVFGTFFSFVSTTDKKVTMKCKLSARGKTLNTAKESYSNLKIHLKVCQFASYVNLKFNGNLTLKSVILLM